MFSIACVHIFSVTSTNEHIQYVRILLVVRTMVDDIRAIIHYYYRYCC